jgi:hypothetical protein
LSELRGYSPDLPYLSIKDTHKIILECLRVVHKYVRPLCYDVYIGTNKGQKMTTFIIITALVAQTALTVAWAWDTFATPKPTKHYLALIEKMKG